ncbi:MAG: diguanylate cyclase [bacterium]|nr:diguanylate cyclase [bacterium]
MMNGTDEQYNILIVDDVPNNIRVAASILQTRGYKLFFATSGTEALAKVKTTRFDLILLDVMMPEMDGFEACRQLKESPGFKDIPIIFLTAKTATEDIVKGFGLGAVDYVTKPFSGSELLARVSTHLELKRAENALKESETKLKKAQRLARLGWYEFKVKENIARMTPEFIEMLKLPAELALTRYDEVLKRYLAVVYPDDRQLVQDYNDDTSWQQNSQEFRVIGTDGNVYYLYMESRREFDTQGRLTGEFGILHEITERKHLEKKLRRLATTDPLTGASNRRHFFETAGLEIKRSQRNNMPLSVMMLDIDHFKNINDTYGHHIGDIALVEVVRICQGTIRVSDLLGRIGGEEFAVLLPETNNEQSKLLAERLRQAIAKIALETSAGVLSLTVSIGLANFAIDAPSLEEALKRADHALYSAKESGRNRVIVNFL